jgi:hypothetical protein
MQGLQQQQQHQPHQLPEGGHHHHHHVHHPAADQPPHRDPAAAAAAPRSAAGGARPRSSPQHASQEERDRRTLQEIQGQEKSLLRACDALQRQADALQAGLAEQRRAKKRMDTPMLQAKAEELLLKQRLLAENAATLRTLRALRCQLEVALSGRRLQALVSSTQVRVLEVSGRDPVQVLRDIAEEEQRLQDQEMILEEALDEEMGKEEAGKQNGNEAGAWCWARFQRRDPCFCPAAHRARALTHTLSHPLFFSLQRSSRRGRSACASAGCWTTTGTACSACGAPGRTFTKSASRKRPTLW